MGFFDEMMETGQGLMQKAKDTTEIRRLSSMNKAYEKKKDVYFAEIGRQYYETNREVCEQEYPEQVAEIRALQMNIEQNKLQIEDISAVGLCPQCGEKVDVNQIYCSRCGAYLKESKEEI